MRALLVIILIIFLQSHEILCQLEYGSVFPIPLTISNEDSNFRHCPIENGIYAHTTNCSLFHMCTFGIHTIYSCIDGFFFNPNNGRCQHLPPETEVNCERISHKIIATNFLALAQPIRGKYMRDRQYYNSYHRRKSATSKCTQTGIYPDILDCSLFHYCRENRDHEIYRCSNEFHFDPKTFMCSAPELVNCQYEPSITIEDDINSICRDHPSGTYLPMINHFDMYIICGNNGKSISKRCESGFIYNALTTACEKGPCTFDSTLCKNEGQCIDEPTIENGFKCICSSLFQGEYCEKTINLEETTEQVPTEEMIGKSFDNLFHQFDETTHTPYTERVNLYRNNRSIITNNVLNNPLRNKWLFDSSSKQPKPFEQIIKMVLIIIGTLIGLFLLGSIVFGLMKLTRFILYSPVNTVNEWKTLHEESNV